MKETRETAPQREKKKRRFSWRWMTVAAVCVYSVVTIISQQNILAARRQEREDLLAREKELQNEIEFMNNDEKYIGSETFVERAAREKPVSYTHLDVYKRQLPRRSAWGLRPWSAA